MRPVVVASLVAGVALSVTVGWFVWRDVPVGAAANGPLGTTWPPRDSSALAPTNTRVRVEVLNGTERAGLARRAVQQLRDYGYDVVNYENAREKPVATMVEVSGTNTALGARVVRALGVGVVKTADDGLPYLDVRITLGVDWQPAPQALRP